jgi:hypothetical protein
MQIVRNCCAALVFLAAFAFAPAASAQWQWVNPTPTGNAITALTWDGSRFVSFDSSAAVLVSPDGISWTSNPTTLSAFVNAIVWGNGVYVATASAFAGATILTSTDAQTWTQHDIGVPLNRIAQALWNGDLQQFVLIADGGVILTSDNGSDWVPQGSGTLEDFNDITWDGSRYVVVGAQGTILTSANGIDWADHSIENEDEPLLSVATDGSVYAIVRGAGPANDHSAILTNGDPTKPANWQFAFGVVDPSARSELTRIVWDGAAFVAVGGIIATSTNGAVWTFVASQALDTLASVAFSGDTIVAADDIGDILVSTPDGQAWAPASSNFIAEDLTSVVWTGSVFAAVGDFGSFLTSGNGLDWDVNNFALPISASALAWGNDTYVAVGSGGIASSGDGFSWDPVADPQLAKVLFRGVVWNGDQFVAVGSIDVGTPPLALPQGVIYTSPDGATWTLQASNAIVGDSINAIVWAGNLFVAVGATLSHHSDGDVVLGPPPVFTSPDGATWTRHSPLGSVIGGTSFNSIAWSGSQFVAVGTPGFDFDSRSIATSADGLQWSYIFPVPPAPSSTAGALESVAWTGSRFVTVGDLTSELTSPDGHTWAAHSTGAAELLSVAASGTQCIAVGAFGTIMREQTLCNADAVFKNGFD